MRIEVFNEGDPSVGIQADRITIEWSLALSDLDAENREYLRKDLAALFSTYTEIPVHVLFEDETDADPCDEE